MSQGYTGIEINPRPYQRESLKKIWEKWQETNRVTDLPYKKLLLVLPTGCGKTMVFSLLTNHVVKNANKRVLILAHRDELIRQAQDKLYTSTGIDSSVEKAQETGYDSLNKVVVASVQTLCAQRRLERYSRDHFDYIIVDETHRILAPTYQRILEYFSDAKVLGVTATPMRGDKKSLGEFFEDVPYEYRLKDAVRDGWLTPIVAETVPVDIDLSECTQSQGDYSLTGVDNAITPHLEKIADEILEKAGDRKVLVFLPLVATSKLMAEILTRKGMEARSIDGKMSDQKRDEAKEWYRNAPMGTALCNSMLLTEGYDQEDINCVVVLRATQSTGLYCQMIGRGTRVLDPRINEAGLTAEERRAMIRLSGKPNLLLLDFLWLTASHRICSPASLVSRNVTGEEAGREFINEGGQHTLDEVEETMEVAIVSAEQEKREQALADKLDALKGKTAQRVDPIVKALSVFDDSITNWEPAGGDQLQPCNSHHINQLEYYGFKNVEQWSCGYAENMIRVCKFRHSQGLCSPKQLTMLSKYGIPNAQTKTFQEATKIIDGLSKSWGKKRGNRRGRR